MLTLRRTLLVTASTALLLAGCGGDADQTAELAQDATQAETYCNLSAELDAQDTAPSEEQLSEIEDVAPPEIAEDVATLVEAVRNQDFESDAATQAEENLREWEAENCAGAGATETAS